MSTQANQALSEADQIQLKEIKETFEGSINKLMLGYFMTAIFALGGFALGGPILGFAAILCIGGYTTLILVPVLNMLGKVKQDLAQQQKHILTGQLTKKQEIPRKYGNSYQIHLKGQNFQVEVSDYAKLERGDWVAVHQAAISKITLQIEKLDK